MIAAWFNPHDHTATVTTDMDYHNQAYFHLATVIPALKWLTSSATKYKLVHNSTNTCMVYIPYVPQHGGGRQRKRVLWGITLPPQHQIPSSLLQ